MREEGVEILAGRGRHVATLERAWSAGAAVRNPLSLLPALVARPRAFGESAIRRDMPSPLVEAMGRCDKTGRRRVLRAIARAAGHSGFDTACRAASMIFEGGRLPDDASIDVLARRLSAHAPATTEVDLRVYDSFVGGGAMEDVG